MQEGKNFLHKILAILSFYLIVEVINAGQYAHYDAAKSACTADNWYSGYADSAQYHYQVMDIRTTGVLTYAVGGFKGDIANPTAGVILIYTSSIQEPDFVLEVAESAQFSNGLVLPIKGVKHIKFSGSDNNIIVGIFETDGDALLVFKVNLSNDDIMFFTFNFPANTCFQSDWELLSFANSGAQYDAIGLYECSNPQNFWVAIYKDVYYIDRFFFTEIQKLRELYMFSDFETTLQGVQTGQIITNTQSVLFTGIVKITPDDISYIYIHSLKEIASSDFDTHSTVLIEINSLLNHVGLTDVASVSIKKFVYDITNKWTLGVYIDQKHFVVIRGDISGGIDTVSQTSTVQTMLHKINQLDFDLYMDHRGSVSGTRMGFYVRDQSGTHSNRHYFTQYSNDYTAGFGPETSRLSILSPTARIYTPGFNLHNEYIEFFVTDSLELFGLGENFITSNAETETDLCVTIGFEDEVDFDLTITSDASESTIIDTTTVTESLNLPNYSVLEPVYQSISSNYLASDMTEHQIINPCKLRIESVIDDVEVEVHESNTMTIAPTSQSFLDMCPSQTSPSENDYLLPGQVQIILVENWESADVTSQNIVSQDPNDDLKFVISATEQDQVGTYSVSYVSGIAGESSERMLSLDQQTFQVNVYYNPVEISSEDSVIDCSSVTIFDRRTPESDIFVEADYTYLYITWDQFLTDQDGANTDCFPKAYRLTVNKDFVQKDSFTYDGGDKNIDFKKRYGKIKLSTLYNVSIIHVSITEAILKQGSVIQEASKSFIVNLSEILQKSKKELIFGDIDEDSQDDSLSTSEQTFWNIDLWQVPNQKSQQMPKVYVQNAFMTPQGVLTIEFNLPILVPGKFEHLQTNWPSSLFEQRQKYFNDTIIYDLIDLKVNNKYDLELPEDIDIVKYNFTRFDEQSLDIQIYFKYPERVSQSLTDSDELIVEFIFASAFIEKQNLVRLHDQTKITVQIPPQISAARAKQVSELEKTVKTSLSLLSNVTLWSNVVVGWGLKYMWTIANMFQFVICLIQWKINISPESYVFIKNLKTLALFEFIDGNSVKNGLKTFFSDEVVSEDIQNQINYQVSEYYSPATLERLRKLNELHTFRYEDGEYNKAESQYFLGAISYFIFVGMIVFILTAVVLLCAVVAKDNFKIDKICQSLKRRIFFNLFIRYFLQTTLGIQLSSATIILISRDENIDDSLFMPVLLLIIYLVMPILFTVFLMKNRHKMGDQDFKEKFGNFYGGLRPEEKSSLTLMVAFNSRRTFFVILTFALFLQPGIQILVLTIGTLLYICYINQILIYENKCDKQVQNLNEWFFLLIQYHFVTFSNLIWSSIQRDIVGYSLIATILTICLLNLIFIFFVNIKYSRRWLKLRYLKKKSSTILFQRERAIQLIKSAQSMNKLIYLSNQEEVDLNHESLNAQIYEINENVRKELRSLVKDRGDLNAKSLDILIRLEQTLKDLRERYGIDPEKFPTHKVNYEQTREVQESDSTFKELQKIKKPEPESVTSSAHFTLDYIPGIEGMDSVNKHSQFYSHCKEKTALKRPNPPKQQKLFKNQHNNKDIGVGVDDLCDDQELMSSCINEKSLISQGAFSASNTSRVRINSFSSKPAEAKGLPSTAILDQDFSKTFKIQTGTNFSPLQIQNIQKPIRNPSRQDSSKLWVPVGSVRKNQRNGDEFLSPQRKNSSRQSNYSAALSNFSNKESEAYLAQINQNMLISPLSSKGQIELVGSDLNGNTFMHSNDHSGVNHEKIIIRTGPYHLDSIGSRLQNGGKDTMRPYALDSPNSVGSKSSGKLLGAVGSPVTSSALSNANITSVQSQGFSTGFDKNANQSYHQQSVAQENAMKIALANKSKFKQQASVLSPESLAQKQKSIRESAIQDQNSNSLSAEERLSELSHINRSVPFQKDSVNLSQQELKPNLKTLEILKAVMSFKVSQAKSPAEINHLKRVQTLSKL